MPPNITNVQLWEKLGALQASHEGMRDEVRRADERAREFREKIYNRIETVDDKVTEQNGRVGNLEEDVAEMKPTVKGLADLRTKAGGVVLALAIVGTIIGGLFGLFLDELKAWIFRLFGH